jgi:hypothetical protein
MTFTNGLTLVFFGICFFLASSFGSIVIYNEELLIALSFALFVFTIMHAFSADVGSFFSARRQAIFGSYKTAQQHKYSSLYTLVAYMSKDLSNALFSHVVAERMLAHYVLVTASIGRTGTSTFMHAWLPHLAAVALNRKSNLVVGLKDLSSHQYQKVVLEAAHLSSAMIRRNAMQNALNVLNAR